MGTAGSVFTLSHPTMPFLVTNGDVISDINYMKFWHFTLSIRLGTCPQGRREVKPIWCCSDRGRYD